jgi:curved DNA-binding protein CbpA
MMTYSIDPYKVLGIPHDASDQDIKRAYKKAALQYHPDRNVDKASCAADTETKMALINEAYSILKDKDKKKEYDHLHRYGGAGCDFNNHYIHTQRQNSANGNNRRHSSFHGTEKNDDNDDDDDDEQELHFHMNPALNPFLFINVPSGRRKRRTPLSSGGSGSFAFAFSSMSSHTAKDGRSKIFTRKYTQYQDGWKHIQIETATVDEFGNTVYKRSMTHEKGKLQNLRDTFSSLLKQNPLASRSKVDPRGDSSSNPTMSSSNHNSNQAAQDGWFHELMSQVRKCTGSCGGLLSLSD